MNELRNRGTEDILLAVVDGLKGFPEATTAVFPDAIVQTCIVHLLRNSMNFVSWKGRKGLAMRIPTIPAAYSDLIPAGIPIEAGRGKPDRVALLACMFSAGQAA